MDKFEEHIKKIRHELDIYSPSPDLWNSIEKRLKKEKSLIKQWYSIAAMIIVILGTAIVLLKPTLKMNNDHSAGSNAAELNSVEPPLKETEIYYNNLVNSLYREAAPLLTTNPEIEKELTNDMSRLDSICSEIKKDLKDNIANQEVVEALIQNYRIKIRLLEDILKSMEENEDHSGKNNKYEL
jgi:hypothetical protein